MSTDSPDLDAMPFIRCKCGRRIHLDLARVAELEAALADRDDTIARVRALADDWEREADEIRQSEGEERDGPSAGMVGIAHGRHKSAIEARAALDGGAA